MKKIVITMLVLLSAAYAVGIGGGEVARKLNLRPSQIVPAADTLPVRNLIYLIGDGMGLSHVSMLMLEEGYGTTAFDRAQNIALITTYSANNRVTDSAAAGTALATGHKTGNGMLGVLPDSTAAESIMADAIRAGMPTGVVVTSTLQHATPGAFYAHVPYRRQYQRISDQLAGSDLTVAFGGGLKYAETSEREDGVPGIERLRDRGFRVLTDPANTGAVCVAMPQDVEGEAYDYPVSFFAKRVWRLERRPATEAALADAAEAIRKAKRPMMICGGGGRSPFWRQMLADMYGCSVSTVQSDQGGALGAAILAGVGAGIYSDLETACDALVRKKDSSEPNMAANGAYAKYFTLYKELYRTLFQSFKDLKNI